MYVAENFKFFLVKTGHLKNCLELDVHHMTAQILSIMILFKTAHFSYHFQYFVKSLNIVTLELETIFRNGKL